MSTILKASQPIAKISLADSVYQRILEAILSGALASGMELSEVALAAELGVSRTPVHEALLRLAADGLVEDLSSRQARVASFSRSDIVEIYEVRQILEPAAAERAAHRLSPEQVAELRAAANALAAAKGKRDWPSRAIDFDMRFHDVVASAAGNERLRQEIHRYRRLVRAFCRATGSRENLLQAYNEHLRILAALETRDDCEARRAMADHIASRLSSVLSEFDSQAELRRV